MRVLRLLATTLAALLSLLALPSLAAPGLVATYFSNVALTAPAALVRVDSSVVFNWGNGAPDASLPVDNFSVRWTGFVRVQTTGSYVFQTLSDDGVRLWVNGTQLINNWTNHGPTADTGAAVTLTAGVDYPVTLEFFEASVGAQIELRWRKPGDTSFTGIPASNGSLGLHTGLTPMLEYRFEQPSWNGTAQEVTDTSSSGWHATAASLSATKPTTDIVSPAVGSTSGTCGYGVFNRANKDYLALPSAFPNLGAAGNFTGTVWIRTTDNTRSGQRILADDENGHGGSTVGFALSLGDGGTGRLRFFSRATPSALSLDTAAVIANNTWYFVAFSLDLATKTKSIVVRDAGGGLVASASATFTETSFGTDTGTASVGGETNAAVQGENSNSFGFSGNIDELRLFPYVLSSTEIATVRGLSATCPSATLLAKYQFEETVWNGTAAELKDSAGHAGGPYHGAAVGTPVPTPALVSPARAGTPGTCGYATLPGPQSNGGSFSAPGLPVSTSAGAQTTVAFWMYWEGTDNTSAVGWNAYAFGLGAGGIGFSTNNDMYGASSAGLSNGWHHVVAVFTNGNVAANRLYIDGVPKVLTQRYGTASAANAVVTSTLRIGGIGASTSFRFKGRLDEVHVYNGGVSAAEVAALYAETHACVVSLHHVDIRQSSATGLTCAPTVLTVVACADSACTTPYTGGASGTLTATGAGMAVSWPASANFSIGAGSSSTTVAMQVTTPGSVVVGTSGLAPAASHATTCSFGSPACTFTAAAAALVFEVVDHVAETSTNFSVSAVGSSGGSCSSAFASSTRSVNFQCSYLNPSTGSKPVRVAGAALNSGNNSSAACDGSGYSISLAFDANGVASTSLRYADVGQMQLRATYTGSAATSDAGLTMVGSDTFIAAPASFGFSAITAAPIKAGNPFAATVTARNSAGATATNFGRETVPEGATLAFVRRQPTGAGASDGVFGGNLGAFSAGVATALDLVWTEVGTGDLTATLASGSYLASGFSATGTTGTGGAVGRFIPHHFTTTLTPACSSFTYAGQPLALGVTARNANGDTTVNYDGSTATSPSFAKAVTLSDITTPATGTLTGNTIAAAAFTAGMASASPVYTFTSKLTAPRTQVLRAVDTDAVSSSGYAEGNGSLRSGRLRLANAFGSARAALQVPVVAEYWTGAAWQLNGADTCTAIAAASVALSNQRGATGGATAAGTLAGAVSLSNGSGLLTLAAPTPAGSSLSLDLAVNLGSTATDQSCNSIRPATTGAGLPWLRAQNGSCAATADRDPAARASFGIFAPETRKTVHVRDLY